MIEKWIDISGYEGIYQVSNLGRVRSLDRFMGGGGAKRKVKGKVLKAFFDGAYLAVNLSNGAARKISVHTLVLEAFVGPRPKGMQCCHNDGNPLNPKLDNLRWGTPKENHKDKIVHGTAPKGERAGGAKLTEDQVLDIKNSAGSSLVLAKKYGVASSTVRAIRLGVNWSYLTDKGGSNE